MNRLVLQGGITPYAYQSETPKYFRRFGNRLLLGDERGLGKTLSSILCAIDMQPKRVLVICPAIVKLQWAREISRFTGEDATILEKIKVEKRRPLVTDRFVIVNYEILGAHWAYIKRLAPELVIVDECHRIVNRTANCSIRTKFICRREGVKGVILMSGTPFVNRPDELWHLLHILLPEEEMVQQYQPFAMRFCKLERARWGADVYKGPKRCRELFNFLRTKIMLRRRKKDVLKDLPEMSCFPVAVPMRNPKAYEEAHNNFIFWLSKQSMDRAISAEGAESLTKVAYLRQLAAQQKKKEEWIDEFLEDEEGKLVVFGYHREILEKLHDRYKDQSVLVYGAKTAYQKQAAIDRFRQDPQVRVLFGNIRACGTGCDGMQEVSSAMAFAEYDWTPGAMDQAMGRLDRIGQKNPPNIYFLLASGASMPTVDERMCRLLQEKQGTLNRVLDGLSGAANLSIYDDLIQEYVEEVKGVRDSESQRRRVPAHEGRVGQGRREGRRLASGQGPQPAQAGRGRRI